MSEFDKLQDESLENIAGGDERTVNNETSGFAYIREEPFLNSRIISKAYNGQFVYTTGKTESNDGYVWYQINLHGEYSHGWIMGQLIGY